MGIPSLMTERRTTRLRTPALARSLVLAALAAESAAWAEPATPAWRVPLPSPIEWCRPLELGGRASLLLCEATGRVHLLDADAGATRFASPLELNPLPRFAGVSGGVAYLFNRSFVYAIGARETHSNRHGPDAALLWKTPAAMNSHVAEQGDPEFLTRVIAAAATPSGVLLVRSDGGVAELDRVDGAARWERAISPADAVGLHLAGDQGAIFVAEPNVWRVAFVDLGSPDPIAKSTSLRADAPVFSALVAEKLFVAGLRQFAVFSRDEAFVCAWPERLSGDPRRWFAVGDRDAALAGGESGSGIFMSERTGATYEVDLDRGAPIELGRMSQAEADETGDLLCAAQHLVRVGRRKLHILPLGDRRADSQHIVMPGRVLAVEVRPPAVYALCAVGDGPDGRFDLVREPLCPLTVRQPAASVRPRESRRLEPPASPRAICFTLGHVVLVLDRELVAYALP